MMRSNSIVSTANRSSPMYSTALSALHHLGQWRLVAVGMLLCACHVDRPPVAISAAPGGDEKRIALTFDDAPRAATPRFTGVERTQRLIEQLAQAGVDEAAFFVTTSKIKSPEENRRLHAYAAAGHLLANHSHSHSWLRNSEVDDYVKDIDAAQAALSELPNVVPWYRFPYLDEGRDPGKRDQVRRALAERRLINGYVTVDNYDWYLDALLQQAIKEQQPIDDDELGRLYLEVILAAIEFYDEIAMATLDRSPAHVLLLHENDLAALYIADLVAALRQRGWRIISPREAYQDPIALHIPDTVFNGQGRVAAIAHERGQSPRELVHPWEDEDALERIFASRLTDVGRVE